MPRFSAGLLPFRCVDGSLQVFLTPMGGPLGERKDAGAWSISKGEYDPAEEAPVQVARREFLEEVGMPAPDGEYLDLGETRLPSGKRVQIYAVETDLPLRFLCSNTFPMEWPPHSGTIGEFPEVDGADWFTPAAAHAKVIKSQRPILQSLLDLVAPHDAPAG